MISRQFAFLFFCLLFAGTSFVQAASPLFSPQIDIQVPIELTYDPTAMTISGCPGMYLIDISAENPDLEDFELQIVNLSTNNTQSQTSIGGQLISIEVPIGTSECGEQIQLEIQMTELNNPNPAQFTQTIDVSLTDNQAPTITCNALAPIDINFDICEAQISIADLVNTSSDNCDNLTISASSPNGFFERGTLFLPAGNHEVTLTAVDECGNSSNCITNIQVNGILHQRPVITIEAGAGLTYDPATCTFEGLPGSYPYTVVLTDPDAQTSGGMASIFESVTNTFTDVTFDDFSTPIRVDFSPTFTDCGSYFAEITVFDEVCGATKQVFFNIIDNVPPMVTCAGPVNLIAPLGSCTAEYVIVAPDITDNCTTDPDVTTLIEYPFPFTAVGDEFPIGTSIITFVVQDDEGNTASCTQAITVAEEAGLSTSLGCHDLLHISLDTSCEVLITPGFMLQGNRYGCLDKFVVCIKDANDLDVPNLLNGDYVGDTLTVSVKDSSGNSCWGRILLEDKWIPALTCGTRLDLACNASIQPTAGGTPGFPLPASVTITPSPNQANQFTLSGFDPCGTATLSYTDTEVPGSTCGTFNRIINRCWVVIDQAGNTDTCKQEIYLENISDQFDELQDCPDDWFGEANLPNNNQGSLLCENKKDPAAANNPLVGIMGWNCLPDDHAYQGHPAPDDEFYPGTTTIKWQGTGRPTIGACAGVGMTFSDTRLNICSSGASSACYKIIRDWLILDWCTGSVNNCQQIIKVDDQQAPLISGISDLTVSVDIWRCQVDWTAPVPTLTDQCNAAPLDYSVDAPGNTVTRLSNGQFQLNDLVLGTHEVIYSSADCCGNEGRDTIQITVIDEVPPVAVCDLHTVVGLTANSNPDDAANGTAKIYAPTFDDGSYDNCSDQVWFKVIRMDEWDGNENGRGGELNLKEGDWDAKRCGGLNGDDDPSQLGEQAYFDEFIKVCCDDTENDIQVVFRVFDIDPSPWEFRNVFPPAQFPQYYTGRDPAELTGILPEAMAVGGALFGHFSDCMVNVEVDDKIAPFVKAPEDIVISCDFDFAFDPDNPNANTDELDAIFGKVVQNPVNVAILDEVIIRDRVCSAHPKFAELAPGNPASDPCYEDLYDINWGKDGYALDNCSATLTQTVTADIECGQGTITRSWVARDLKGNVSNTASQTIRIISCRPFYVPTVCWRMAGGGGAIGSCSAANSYTYKLISWPCDLTMNSCVDNIDAFKPANLVVSDERDRAPEMDRNKCNFLAATYQDTRFVLEDNACVKIFREWTVIDWCLFEEAKTNSSIVYEWQYTQVIKLINSTGPVFMSGCADQTVAGQNADCSGDAVLEVTAEDDCTPANNIRYRYQIDLDDDGTINEMGYSDNFSSNPFGNLTARVFTNSNPNANGTYPLGRHKISWTATDGCDNETACFYFFTIEDGTNPTPNLLSGISTIPMPVNAGGFVNVPASHFNIKSTDNCTDLPDLRFSYSATNVNDNNRTFTCVQAGNGIVIDTLTVYVWDEAGNNAGAPVKLTLSDCNNQTQATISGAILNEEQEDIADVMVYLEGNLSEQQLTLVDGQFNFDAIPVDHNYRIRPEKDINPLNGVSTYDLVLMSKHILGLETLNSPYKMIAADINQSGSITAFDMVELRKLILYINDQFPDNTSWRFIPANYRFSNQSQPFNAPFPEVYQIDDLNEDLQINFVAIKTGDVNHSARANQLIADEDRNEQVVFPIELQDQELVKGQTYELTFDAKALDNLLGLQYTLRFDPNSLAVQQITPLAPGMTQQDFGTRYLQEGILTNSYLVSNEVESQTSLFRLTVTALETVRLSEVLSINSSYTQAEAYHLNGSTNTIALQFNTVTEPAFELLQNYPNPFRKQTSIDYYLPETAWVQLSIYDVSGKVLLEWQGEGIGGWNKWLINQSDLATNGLLYYTLETASGTATKKMIVLD